MNHSLDLHPNNLIYTHLLFTSFMYNLLSDPGYLLLGLREDNKVGMQNNKNA